MIISSAYEIQLLLLQQQRPTPTSCWETFLCEHEVRKLSILAIKSDSECHRDWSSNTKSLKEKRKTLVTCKLISMLTYFLRIIQNYSISNCTSVCTKLHNKGYFDVLLLKENIGNVRHNSRYDLFPYTFSTFIYDLNNTFIHNILLY